jgi:hypothetical protein
MRNHGLGRRLVFGGAMGVGCWVASVVGLPGSPAVPTAVAGSCFSVAMDVVCIEAESIAPLPWHMPPVMIPAGVDGDGEDEDIVIRDDGGRHVARG